MMYDADYVGTLASDLAAERARIEGELLGAILSDPPKGIEAAEREGVRTDLFEQDDYQAIYVAAVHGRDCGWDKLTVLRAARTLLRHLNLWDETDTRDFTRGMVWCWPSLIALACSYPGPSVVTGYARLLRRIDARQRQGHDCWHRMVGLLAGTMEPDDAPAAVRRHQILFKPVKWKGEKYVLN